MSKLKQHETPDIHWRCDMLLKLQKKFVLLTTIISVVVMLLIAVSINVANYFSIMGHSDEILNLLVQGDLKMGVPLSEREPFPMEIAFTTRFFSIRSDSNDEIDHIDTRNISSVSADKAVEYANIVRESGVDSGIIDNFRYVKTQTSVGYAYFFLDIESDIMGFEQYLFYSVLIVICAVVMIFFLSLLLSKKAVSPISDSYERQKGFITNVSHEFKTPLSIIKADCDVIEIVSGEGEWTDSIKTQITRLDTLVENLVSLTKLDEKIEILKTDFSLSDAVVDTASEFSSSLKNAQLNLCLDIIPNITYNGDEQYIRNLISILTENAIKYSLAQTEVKISLNTNGNKRIFTIENSCENIETGKHNLWFERFYRGDKSRNTRTKGFGIGLSIAKTICDLHGAKISAESKTGKEIIITIIF